MHRDLMIDAGDASRLRKGKVVEVTCPAAVGPMSVGATVVLTSRGGGRLRVFTEALVQWQDAHARGPWMCTARFSLISEVSHAA